MSTKAKILAYLAGLGLIGAVVLQSHEEKVAAARRGAAPQRPAVETVSTFEEKRTIELPAATVGQLGTALAAQQGRVGAVDEAIAAARAGKIDSIELGKRLREATAGHPELGGAILEQLVRERSPAVALQLAQSLANLLDDPALLSETVRELRAAPDEARQVGLLALLGRGHPKALELAADTLADGSPEARATAAFLLNNAPGGLSGETAVKARNLARAALLDPNAGARLREESATLLGQPGAAGEDLALLERTVFEGEPAVRMRALAALERAGGDAAHLRDIFERAKRDANAPPKLVEMATAWLSAHH